MRLDDKLTPATPILPYPKPDTEYPIKTKEHIYKLDEDAFNSYAPGAKEKIEYYWIKEDRLFTNNTLKRRLGYLPEKRAPYQIGVYDLAGDLEGIYNHIKDIPLEDYLEDGIRKSAKNLKKYKQKHFRFYPIDEEPPEHIEVDYICIIDEIPFASYSEAGRYLGSSRQAVHQARQRNSAKIKDKEIIWIKEE
jgi:hypothetical protein